METLETKNYAKKYCCKKCIFSCSKQSDWNRHILTRKHKMEINGNNGNKNYTQQIICDKCSRIFKTKSGLWKHIKVCFTPKITPKNAENSNTESSTFDKELLVKMMLQNQEVMQNIILQNKDVMTKMIELMPQVGYTNSHNTVNNTLTNSNNTNHFNIQMFLNEHCKNAMNLTDFIESLPITAETYDNTLENGLTKSMTHLITNGLSQLDVLE